MTLQPRESNEMVDSILRDIPNVFRTTDFDFAAYLMTVCGDDNKPLAEVMEIVPHDRSNTSPGQGYRYVFVLAGRDGHNVQKPFSELERKYTNRQLMVEPIVFMATRRQLRALMDKQRIKTGNAPNR